MAWIAVQPHVGVLRAQQARVVVDRLAVDRVGRRPVADHARDHRHDQADAAVGQRAQQRRGRRTRRRAASRATITSSGNGEVAQRRGRVDHDRRRVQPSAAQPSSSSESWAASSSSSSSSSARARPAIRSRSSSASACGQQRDRVAARRGVHDHGREPEGLLEDAAAGVDVLDAHPRHQRARDLERARLDVDALVAHVPAPARVAQRRNQRASRARPARAARPSPRARARRRSSPAPRPPPAATAQDASDDARQTQTRERGEPALGHHSGSSSAAASCS